VIQNPHPHSQDEVLAHRLGLVPINVDPALLEWRGAEDAASEANTVVLRLNVRCSKDAAGGVVNESGEKSGRECI
jgi:DNA-directed RNA polymerase I and III subunit RPAC1